MVDSSAEKLNFHLASVGKGRAVRGEEAGGRQGLSSDKRQRIRGKTAKDEEREGRRRESRTVTKSEEAEGDRARPQRARVRRQERKETKWRRGPNAWLSSSPQVLKGRTLKEMAQRAKTK